MLSDNKKNTLNRLIKDFNFSSSKKFKLVILWGLLGDFDSFEYALNLKEFIKHNKNKDIDIFAIAIGDEVGKNKFCNFTGFSRENLKVVNDNRIHKELKISEGVDIGLGGWINMLIMLSGINSLKTIKEVI